MKQDRAKQRAADLPEVVNPRRKRRTSKDPLKFLSTYFADSFTQKWTSVRKAIVESVAHAAKYGGDQAIAAPRGEGKTSIVERLAIWLLFTGQCRFIVICAASGTLAEQILENIKFEIETNDLLLEDWPEICSPIRALEGNARRAHQQTVGGKLTRAVWGRDKVVLPTVEGSKASGSILRTAGMDAAIRGIRVRGVRPDLVIIDDPETRESARSESQRIARGQIIEGDLGGLGGPDGGIARVMLTTVQTPDSLSASYTDPTCKPWSGVRFRFLDALPDRTDLWEEYLVLCEQDQLNGDSHLRTAFRYYKTNRKEMDAGAQPTNVQRFEKTKLPDGTNKELSAVQHFYNKVHRWGWDTVLCEYQNDPPQPENVVGLSVEAITSRIGAYPRGEVPEATKALTAFIDLGDNYLHWAVVAWRRGQEGFVVDAGVDPVYTKISGNRRAIEYAILSALRERKSQFATTEYKCDGEPRQIDVCMIDCGSGFHAPAVATFVKETGQRIYRAAKGFGRGKQMKPWTGGRRTGKYVRKSSSNWIDVIHPDGVAMIEQNVDYWKHALCERIETVPGQPGALVLFHGDEMDDIRVRTQIAKHCTGERFEDGIWVRKGDNHFFDCLVGCTMAADYMGVTVIPKGAPPKEISLSKWFGG